MHLSVFNKSGSGFVEPFSLPGMHKCLELGRSWKSYEDQKRENGLMCSFIKEGGSRDAGALAAQTRGPEFRSPETHLNARQRQWPTYNLSTWEVEAAVPWHKLAS